MSDLSPQWEEQRLPAGVTTGLQQCQSVGEGSGEYRTESSASQCAGPKPASAFPENPHVSPMNHMIFTCNFEASLTWRASDLISAPVV